MFLGYNFSAVPKKTVTVAVAALLAAVALSAQPNKNATEKQGAATQKNPPVVLATPNRQNEGETNTAKPSTDPPAHTPLKDPNWVLVIVGSITCGVIGWQSWETRKAAEAAFLQIQMMKDKERARIEVKALGLELTRVGRILAHKSRHRTS